MQEGGGEGEKGGVSTRDTKTRRDTKRHGETHTRTLGLVRPHSRLVSLCVEFGSACGKACPALLHENDVLLLELATTHGVQHVFFDNLRRTRVNSRVFTYVLSTYSALTACFLHTSRASHETPTRISSAYAYAQQCAGEDGTWGMRQGGVGVWFMGVRA